MKLALATTILTGWNYPHPIFSYVPTADDRAPFLLWTRLNGFDGIDLADSWMNWHAKSDDDLHQFRAQLDGFDLDCCALNPYRCSLVGHPDAAANERKLHRAVEVATILGARYLNVALSDPFPALMTDAERADRQTRLRRGEDYSDADWKLAAEKLQRLADRAAQTNVELSIELHDDGMIDRSIFALKLLDLIDRDNVGVNPDLQNGYRVPYATENWRDALVAMASHTNLWHVKSCTRHYDATTGRYVSQRASLRAGDIDYRWAVSAMHRAGFDGWVSIESGAGPGDPLSAIEADHNYFRSIVRDWLAIYGR